MKNPESLTDIAEGLNNLAKAISQGPQLLKTAYQAGFLDGAIIAAVALLLLAFLWNWRRQ